MTFEELRGPAPSQRELLRAVAGGARGPVLRLDRPAPTVAFGRLDKLRPGYADALEAARAHGFAVLEREPGGRAAAYGPGCLVVEAYGAGADAMTGMHERFQAGAAAFAAALESLGVDARVGEVPGAYCPGEFSVNARGAVKLVGTAQRVMRGAWLLAAVVVVDDAASLRAVLTDVYRALAVPWDPATVGAVAEEAPGVTVAAVEAAVVGRLGDATGL
jgi:lipoate-protein ligase A